TPAWFTGLLLASCNCTTGCWRNATPLWALLEGAVVSTSFVAAPAVPVAVNVTGLPVSPVAVAVSVLVPAVGLRVHDVSAAMPSAPVLTGVVGVTAPPPAAGVNVTTTFATGFPLASFTITEGGGLTAVPAGAEVPPPFAAIVAAGPAVPVAEVPPPLPAIVAAAPAVSVIPAVVGVSVPLPKLRV